MADQVTLANTASVPIKSTNLFINSLEEVRPEFKTVDKDDLPPITLDPVTTTVTLRGVLPRLLAMRDELAKVSTFEIRCLDRLELYLHAWLRTNAIHLGTVLPPESFSALVEKVTNYRAVYMKDIEAMISRKVLNPGAIDDLKSGTSHRGIIGDVLVLTTLFRSNWQRIAGKSCITLAELDEADADLDTLMSDMGLRERPPASAEETALERHLAYTLLVRAYDQVRRAVIFLRWNEGDADEIAPSLFGGRKKKSALSETSDVDTTTPATTTPTTATSTTSTTGAPTPFPGSKEAKPGVGMPGSDPFGS